MSETEKIAAETRTEFGKGAARRIRRDNKIPAVIYGHGADPLHVTLPGHQTMMALKHGGSNALLALDFDGTEHLALTKQVQVDPIRRVIEHIDFVTVTRGEKVTVDVAIHVVGDAAPDTLVVTENNTIQVEAEATHTDEIGEEILAWQRRPLESLYPVIYLDALVVKVRDGVHVINKAAHIAVASTWTASSTSWHLDPGHRRGKVLGRGVRRPGQPRHPRRVDRVLRRTHPLRRGA